VPAVLDEKINPNEAPAGSLVRLPGIGLGRAEAIVAYRNGLSDDDRPAFESVQDLQKVSGIGAKTAQDVQQWLRFE
jgi:competence ComEA-like helix-hairpin-helix protein